MKDWEESEEIIKLIEKAISPEAVVERNIFLPNLSSSKGAKCQCDIVITSGVGARKTISIVEVQKRGRKVEINTFRGWCEKMRDVGAQHLICVSEIGFPESVIEKAEAMGPSIRLLTLKQLGEHDEWPVDFLSNTIQNPRRELKSISSAEIVYKHHENTEGEPLNINMNERCFKLNGFHLTALDLFFAHLDYIEGLGRKFASGIHTIEFALPINKEKIECKVQGKYQEIIDFKAHYEVDILERSIPFVLSRYNQIDYGDTVAWLMSATVYQKDEENIIDIVLIPEGNGMYRMVFRKPNESI